MPCWKMFLLKWFSLFQGSELLSYMWKAKYIFPCTDVFTRVQQTVYHMGFPLETKRQCVHSWQQAFFSLEFTCCSRGQGAWISDYSCWTPLFCWRPQAGHTPTDIMLSEAEMNLGPCRETFTSLSVDVPFEFVVVECWVNRTDDKHP